MVDGRRSRACQDLFRPYGQRSGWNLDPLETPGKVGFPMDRLEGQGGFEAKGPGRGHGAEAQVLDEEDLPAVDPAPPPPGAPRPEARREARPREGGQGGVQIGDRSKNRMPARPGHFAVAGSAAGPRLSSREAGQLPGTRDAPGLPVGDDIRGRLLDDLEGLPFQRPQDRRLAAAGRRSVHTLSTWSRPVGGAAERMRRQDWRFRPGPGRTEPGFSPCLLFAINFSLI